MVGAPRGDEAASRAIVDDASAQSGAMSLRWRMLEVALITVIFTAEGAWPVPDVNESHYLVKAKHFWDPTFAAGDFFLESADGHVVFYALCGWPTLWMSLSAYAWCGRIITWIALACAWQSLSSVVVTRRFLAVLSAALFIVLQRNCSMAGEWVVGGFEAKGIAYALVWFALAAMVRGKWMAAWILVGLATSMHPLVGGWTAIATFVAWLRWSRASVSDRYDWRAPAIAGLLALPGLIPVLTLDQRVDPQIIAEAARIYVYERLPHHLDPHYLIEKFVLRHVPLVAVWFLLARLGRQRGDKLGPVTDVANVAFLAAVVGLYIGYVGGARSPLAAVLLRFYWFRLTDVMLPLGVALYATAQLVDTWRRRPLAAICLLSAVLVVIAMNATAHLRDRLSVSVPRGNGIVAYADWIAACRWAAANTPPNAIFVTPRRAQSFKWHAGRGEVVNRKHVPQSLEAIVEWWARLCDLDDGPALMPHERDTMRHEWRKFLKNDDKEDVRKLAQRYRASFVIIDSNVHVAGKLVYQNNSYLILRIEP